MSRPAICSSALSSRLCGRSRNRPSRPSWSRISIVEGWTVSPRKSRKKSACFSRTRTLTPARAKRKPAIIPAGPPPTMITSAFAAMTSPWRVAARASNRRLDCASGPSGRAALELGHGRPRTNPRYRFFRRADHPRRRRDRHPGLRAAEDLAGDRLHPGRHHRRAVRARRAGRDPPVAPHLLDQRPRRASSRSPSSASSCCCSRPGSTSASAG